MSGTDGTKRRGRTPLRDERVERVMVCLPPTLRDRLDRFGTRHGYTSRSEVVRRACERLLREGGATA